MAVRGEKRDTKFPVGDVLVRPVTRDRFSDFRALEKIQNHLWCIRTSAAAVFRSGNDRDLSHTMAPFATAFLSVRARVVPIVHAIVTVTLNTVGWHKNNDNNRIRPGYRFCGNEPFRAIFSA